MQCRTGTTDTSERTLSQGRRSPSGANRVERVRPQPAGTAHRGTDMQRSNAPSRMAAWRSALVRRGVFAGLGLALLFLAGGGLALASGAAIGPAGVTLGFGVAIGWVVTAAIYMLTVARPLGRLTRRTRFLFDGPGFAAGARGKRSRNRADRHRAGARRGNGSVQADPRRRTGGRPLRRPGRSAGCG